MNAVDDLIGVGGEVGEFVQGTQALIDRGVLGVPTSEAKAGAANVAGRSRRTLFTEAVRWMSPQPHSMYSLGDLPVARTDTVAGRIIAGVVKSLWSTSDVISRWTMSFMAQSLTNIPAYRFMQAREKGSTERAFATEMRTLLQDAQYGHIFTSQSLSSIGILLAVPDRTLYTDHTAPVRIRFDLPMDQRNIRSISVLNGTSIVAQNAGGTYIEVLPTAFAMLGAYDLTLRVTTTSGTTLTHSIPRIITAYSVAPGTAPGLMPLPPNAPNTESEKAILRTMRFPFEDRNWYYRLSSPEHNGPLRYSLDFNATNDETSKVHAPTAASVSKVDLYKGEVSLASSLPSGQKWKMQFLHMDHIFDAQLSAAGKTYTGIAEVIRLLNLESVFAAEIKAKNKGVIPALSSQLFAVLKEIEGAKALLKPYMDRIDAAQKWIDENIVGTELPAWSILGEGGDEGLSDGTHIHMHAINNDGTPINLYAWAHSYQPGILAKTLVDGKGDEYLMKYDDSVGALVNEAEKVVHKRVDINENGKVKSENWVYAWEASVPVSQMKRVVWKKIEYIDDNGARKNDFIWVQTEDNTQRWKVTNGVGNFVPCIPQ